MNINRLIEYNFNITLMKYFDIPTFASRRHDDLYHLYLLCKTQTLIGTTPKVMKSFVDN